ncbi:MAG: response regulator transcription factor [Chloroflexales bacterium]|nr:response regulator transcription factor [Chloroflexales bacterium]
MSTAPAIRVVTVDDQAIFRAGIKQICSAAPDITVAGEAARCGDALVLCDRLRPDLLLLDGALPGALSLIAQLREHHHDVGVLILADRVDETLLRRGLQLGIMGYVLKQVEAFDLIQAIRGAAGGLLTLTPEVATFALSRPEQPEPAQDMLSEREQAVLSLLLHGMSNNTIAARLRVSRATVKFHLRNIYSKLGVCSRTEALAVVYGQRRAAVASPSEMLPELPRRRALGVAV